MPKYRSKVVEIEAEQLERDNADRLVEWVCDNGGHAELVYGPLGEFIGVSIHTLEGTMEAHLGDFIIRGTEGEFYPCKPSVMARKYEPVE